MIVDGTRGETFQHVSSPVFSADSRHFAYVARSRGKIFAVIDGKKGEEFDFVGPVTFSTDGRKAAFGIRTGHELWWRVVDVP